MAASHTIVADSPDLRERLGLVASLISVNFGSEWSAEPLPGEQRAARLSWGLCDGVGVSRAHMSPLRLRGSGITAVRAREPLKYYLYTADAVSRLSIDGQEHITAQPGEVLILSNHMAMDWIMADAYTCSNFVIEADIFHQHIRDPKRILGRPLALPYGFSGIVRGMLDAAWAMAVDGEFERCGSRFGSSFLNALSVALSVGEAGEPESTHPTALELRRQQVRSYIDRRFHQSTLTVGDMARHLGLTARYLQLAFAAEGESPLDCLRARRLSEAAMRLREPAYRRDDITRIAFDCGFNSSAHFATEFRRRYGVSPREYRQGGRAN
jgi:AraC-like DNA-binding protein